MAGLNRNAPGWAVVEKLAKRWNQIAAQDATLHKAMNGVLQACNGNLEKAAVSLASEIEMCGAWQGLVEIVNTGRALGKDEIEFLKKCCLVVVDTLTNPEIQEEIHSAIQPLMQDAINRIIETLRPRLPTLTRRQLLLAIKAEVEHRLKSGNY